MGSGRCKAPPLMRRRRMLRYLPIALWLALLTLIGCSPDPQGSEVACEVAAVHASNFRREAGRPVAVWTRPSPLGPSIEQIETFLHRHPDLRNDPDLPLIQAAAQAQRISPVSQCPGLRASLKRAGVLVDDAIIEQKTRGVDWPIAALAMSMPVLSADGSTAILYVSEYWGSLSGSMDAVTYKKDLRGAWVLAGRTTLAVS